MTFESRFETALESWMVLRRHQLLHVQLQRLLMGSAQYLLARPINRR